MKVKARAVFRAAGALAVGVLLVACSGDSGSEDGGDAIDDVQTEPEAEPSDNGGGSESPEATPSDDGIDRPEIELPDDMNNVFEDTETGDDRKDAILDDLTQQISAIDMAIAESNPSLDAVEFYTIEDALITARQYIRGGSDNDRSWAGTAEYYDFDVSIPRPGSATVTYCIDSTGVQTKELNTGELLPKPEDAQNFNYTQKVLQQNEQGVWQVSLVMARDAELDRRCER
ncbi:hypothetical protein [Streptomyces sp. 6N223]|uniref:hypothetical protein n=1 Tax=Streptomyces sp. 6N223 TaxID=3457412 RepID=UPI003FD3BE29